MISLFERKIDPVRQAAVIFGGSVAVMLGGWALTATGIFTTEKLFAWSIATGFLLLFGIFNSVLSLNADSSAGYWGRSMYSFLGLAFANGMAAWGVSGIPVGEAESYKWIYVVVTVGFLVFISMVNAMRKIVEFAEREEWNQPRRRNR